jgi:hypothetical protein
VGPQVAGGEPTDATIESAANRDVETDFDVD